ncbi:MAG TPA: TonB-dependent receptor [Gemmatimonadales bacterium]|nr:TonB-dependent receptor [Gemmatimonadales bacterium]
MHLLLVAALLAQQPDTLRLPDVITTASHLQVRAGALSSTHTVITGAELRERGITLLLDALRDVPGLVTVQSGSYGAATSLFLRGGESDYVKVLVDGVTMNSPGGAFNFANLSIENVERIEVVRGPASVLHGADAMAGVVQVFTRRGAGVLTPEISLEAGGLGNRRVGGALQGGGRLGTVSLQVGRATSDGLYDFNNDYRHSGASGRLDTRPDAPVTGSLTARYSDVRSAFPTNSSGEAVDSNQFVTERQAALSATVARRLSSALTVQLRGTASRTEDGFSNRMDHPGDTTGFGFAGSRDGRTHRTGADLRLRASGRGPLAATVGFQYEDERQRQAGSTTSNFGSGVFTQEDAFRAQRSTRAAYGEAAYVVGELATLNAGVRLDDNSAFGSAGTWRLGGTLHPSAGLTLRAQAGRAFKAPTFAELFAISPFEVGDPALQPEQARSWEVGAEQLLAGGRARVSAAWFSQLFRDLIQYAAAAPGEPTYGNVAAATSRGLEVGALVVPHAAWSVSVQATALRTRVTDAGGGTSPAFREGGSLVRRPDFTAALGARWQPSPATTVRVDVHHLGARDDVDFREWPATRIQLPSRTTADVAASRSFRSLVPGLTITGRIENLFDARWQQVVGFRARGRVLHFGVTVGG